MTPQAPSTPAWDAAREQLRHVGERPLIACSGGADSIALAALCASFPLTPRWSPTITHINHHLRPDSGHDQNIAHRTAQTLALPFRCVDLDPQQILKHPRGLEAGARQLRYDALCSVAHDVGATSILTAHHAQDRLETVLLHLMEGTGIRGLAGPRRVTRWHRTSHPPVLLVRPLLDIWPEELRAWLRDLALPWAEDASNQDLRFARNRLRADVIPPMRALAAPPALARSLSQLAEDAALLEQLLCPHLEHVVLQRTGQQLLIDRPRLGALDPELRRAVLLRLVASVADARIDARFITDVARRAPEKGRLTLLGHRLRAELTTAHIRIARTEDPRSPLPTPMAS